MRLSATKEFKWDCAHLLDQHEGLCQNLHGHTYKMEVTIEGPTELVQATGPAKGMVADFKEIKTFVNEYIVNRFDHACVINTTTKDEFEKELYEILAKYKKKVVEIAYRPTAENMALAFIHQLNELVAINDLPWNVTRIRLWETPTSYAEVTR